MCLLHLSTTLVQFQNLWSSLMKIDGSYIYSGQTSCYTIVFGLAKVPAESVDEEFFCLCGDSSQSRQGETGVPTSAHTVLEVEVVHREGTIKSVAGMHEIQKIV